jgi:DNA-binding LytR/AlgR family response regulator
MDFFVKSRSKERYERIRLCDVVYVETGGSSNIIIHTEQGSYKFSTSLSRFQSQYNSTSLVKLHQSYIVNWDKVIAITPVAVFVEINGEEQVLNVGRLEEYRNRFAELVNKLKS